MNEPINEIAGVLNHTLFPISESRMLVSSSADLQVDIQKTSFKYKIQNNLIVFEKYDCQGKLISRVPSSPKPVDENA
jgi:hypothetical protein